MFDAMEPDINQALEELLRHGLEGNFATFDEYDFDFDDPGMKFRVSSTSVCNPVHTVYMGRW